VNPPISQKKWVGHPGLTVKVKWVGHPAPRFNRQGKMGGAPGEKSPLHFEQAINVDFKVAPIPACNTCSLLPSSGPPQ